MTEKLRTPPHQAGIKEEDVKTWSPSANKFESGKESALAVARDAQLAELTEEQKYARDVLGQETGGGARRGFIPDEPKAGVTDVMNDWDQRTIPLDVEKELKAFGILSDTSYTIQKGDTLSEIAERHSRGIEELMEMNPQIKDADQIFAGDTLQMGQLIKSPFDEIEPYDFIGQFAGKTLRTDNRMVMDEDKPKEPKKSSRQKASDLLGDPLRVDNKMLLDEDRPIEQAIQSIIPNVVIEEGLQELDKIQQEFTDARENEARQKSEAKVLAKRKEHKESSKKRELASEERMKKNLVEQAKKVKVEKEVAQLDKTTEKAVSKKLWSEKTRYEKDGYYSLSVGGPKVSKKVYDEHLKGVINSYIEQVKKREEESSTGLEDIKQYPDKRLLERLRDLEFKNIDKKLGSIEKKEMATIKQEIKNRNRTPPTYRRGYKLKPLPLG
jgi:murein DD-endopeptidase MepM/ murein hydrolase activator NlpD